jgi:hypothetical protein
MSRLAFTSRRSFSDVLAKLESMIGRPDMSKFKKDTFAATSEEELDRVVHGAVGPAIWTARLGSSRRSRRIRAQRKNWKFEGPHA